MSEICHDTKDGVVLEVVLSPRSSQEKILGLYNNRLKVCVTAPPVDGKANGALCKFLAKKLKVPAGQVSVIRGMTSREKSIEILGISVKELLEKLELSVFND